MHEAQLYENNSFITLTYDNEHLPADYSIDVRVWQKFMKRLRKSLGSKKIRFFASGEYGDENLRPHYHALIFNHDFGEKVLYKIERGNRLYTSSELSKVWPYGLATLGDVTFESAAYVARYVCKKITGDMAGAHYTRVHPLTKEICHVKPEDSWQSRRPGIASGWLSKFKSDVYPSDFVIARGAKSKPPRYYDQQLTEEELTQIKRSRIKNALPRKADRKSERRRARAAVRDARMRVGNLKRTL